MTIIRRKRKDGFRQPQRMSSVSIIIRRKESMPQRIATNYINPSKPFAEFLDVAIFTVYSFNTISTLYTTQSPPVEVSPPNSPSQPPPAVPNKMSMYKAARQLVP